MMVQTVVQMCIKSGFFLVQMIQLCLYNYHSAPYCLIVILTRFAQFFFKINCSLSLLILVRFWSKECSNLNKTVAHIVVLFSPKCGLNCGPMELQIVLELWSIFF